MVTHKLSKWEGKIGVGMTPTNLHYYSNKVYLMKITMFWSWNMIYPVKFYPIKGLQTLLGLTLLEDFNTLLEVYLVRGLQLTTK